MTILWLVAWFVFGMPRPQMFVVVWDVWGITLAVSVVIDSAWLRDLLREGHPFASHGRAGRVGWFLANYAGMGIAMVLGMLVMGPVLGLLSDFGFPYLDDTNLSIHLLDMALFMSIPMVAGMWFRGYGWERMAEMAGVMFGPALLMIALSSAVALSPMTLMDVGHALMWVSMLALMLWRWSDYSHFVRAPRRHAATARAGQIGLAR